MEIKEYAHRVLFASSLEEKLSSSGAGEIVDTDPGAALLGVPTPGRPEMLRMRPRGERVRAALPSRASLVDDERRGALLHFFANHELLAAELMALALLKFPDAPAEFREGLFRTLREEQRHTRWYVERMRECGVTFGDLPVNRFFWDAVAPMETPLDYVSRLCLTFEQANLDYSKHFAGLLREAGDDKSARILDSIYRDEINHVGYGLKWFRRWKSPTLSDWEAYQSLLDFPLSPVRAKATGAIFNARGRSDAGLDEDFIRALDLYERSRGRTPNVFRFQADAEDDVAATRAGIRHHRRRAMQCLVDDLEILPAFLARRDDVVLVGRVPSAGHRTRLREAGLELPEFETLDPGETLPPTSLLRQRKLDQPRPWAWSPAMFRLLNPLAPRFSKQGEAFFPPDDTGWGQLLSKSHWAGRFEEPESGQPRVCHSLEEVLDVAGQWGAVVIKSPWGAAGRGQKRLSHPSELESGPVLSWLGKILRQQTTVVVERWWQRAFDFSVQYDMTSRGLVQQGLTRLENDERGVFRACVWQPKFCQGLPVDLARFLMEETLPLYATDKGVVARRLESLLQEVGYLGPVGIDAFVWRSEEGSLGLRRVCEVNARFTMGRVTLELARRVSDGCRVRFSVIPISSDPVVTPLICDAKGRLQGGTLELNDRDLADQWMALLEVRK